MEKVIPIKEEKPLISVIVPVYNGQDYLEDCITSIEHQTYDNLEIIIINDGSTDSCPSILAEFSAQYPNLTVIHKENGGVTTARNTGLDAAQGEYIWFVDADDFLKPNILGALQRKILAENCDRLIVGGYQFTDTLTDEAAA